MSVNVPSPPMKPQSSAFQRTSVSPTTVRTMPVAAPVPVSQPSGQMESGTMPGAFRFCQRAGFSHGDDGTRLLWNPPWSHGSMAVMPHARWLRQLSAM